MGCRHVTNQNYFRNKNEIQTWLKGFEFNYFITIEPNPSKPPTEADVEQRLRKITFDMNKKYLKTRHFPKFPYSNKFWAVGFREGDYQGNQHQLHYHFLLYTPKSQPLDIWSDLHFPWIKFGGKNLSSRSANHGITFTKDRYHFGNEELIPKLPLHVERVRNNDAAVHYASKNVDPNLSRLLIVGIRV